MNDDEDFDMLTMRGRGDYIYRELIGGHPFGYLDTPLWIPEHPPSDTGTL